MGNMGTRPACDGFSKGGAHAQIGAVTIGYQHLGADARRVRSDAWVTSSYWSSIKITDRRSAAPVRLANASDLVGLQLPSLPINRGQMGDSRATTCGCTRQGERCHRTVAVDRSARRVGQTHILIDPMSDHGLLNEPESTERLSHLVSLQELPGEPNATATDPSCPRTVTFEQACTGSSPHYGANGSNIASARAMRHGRLPSDLPPSVTASVARAR